MNSSTHFPIHFHVLENVSWSARFLHQLLQWNHPLIQWWYIHLVSGRPIQMLGGGKILPLTVHFYDPIHKLWNRLKLQQLQEKRHYIICVSIVNRVLKQHYQRTWVILKYSHLNLSSHPTSHLKIIIHGAAFIAVFICYFTFSILKKSLILYYRFL